jgi:diphthamide synthase (EF-2-diphthine--ammonia ligase)
MKKPILLSWSGGKDSALALHALRSSPDFEPAGLLTTINEDYDRISVHGVRRELLERQAASIGLPLHKVLIPKDCPNEIYEDRLAAALREAKAQGIHHVAFGDLFLEDIRAYREKQMAALGLTPVFPVWGLDTAQLARDFIDHRSRLPGPPGLRGHRGPRFLLRGPPLRREPPARPAAQGRSLRRKRRISHLRPRRADLP